MIKKKGPRARQHSPQRTKLPFFLIVFRSVLVCFSLFSLSSVCPPKSLAFLQGEEIERERDDDEDNDLFWGVRGWGYMKGKEEWKTDVKGQKPRERDA